GAYPPEPGDGFLAFVEFAQISSRERCFRRAAGDCRAGSYVAADAAPHTRGDRPFRRGDAGRLQIDRNRAHRLRHDPRRCNAPGCRLDPPARTHGRSGPLARVFDTAGRTSGAEAIARRSSCESPALLDVDDVIEPVNSI